MNEELPTRLADSLLRYENDCPGFSHDIIGAKLSKQQEDLLGAISEYDRVAAAAGHGVGKSFGFACAGWWWVLTRYNGQVLATGPSSHQVYDVLWKELVRTYHMLPQALSSRFTVTKQRIFNISAKETWFIQARTARADNPTAIQGRHGKHLLALIDEGCGVADAVYETLEGAMTEDDNKIMMAANPTRVNGYFADAFHPRRGKGWKTFNMSCMDSPFVKDRYWQSLIERYGIDSNIVKVRVFGEFPTSEPEQIIGIDVARGAVMRDVSVHTPIVWAFDCAVANDDESVLAKRHGHLIKPLKAWVGLDPEKSGMRIAEDYNKTPKDEKPLHIIIDANGVGAGTFAYLRNRNYPVVPFNAGGGAVDSTRYANAGTEIWFKMEEEARLGFLSLPDDDELIAQMTSRRKQLEEKAAQRLLAEPKSHMKRVRHLPSPDRADAVAMTYWGEAAGLNEEDDDDIYKRGRADSGYEYDEFG